MSFTTKSSSSIAAFAVVWSVLGFGMEARAQRPLSDYAIKNLVGNWSVADERSRGREIKFFIKDSNPSFHDSVLPGFVLTGTYRQDQEGGDYVLIYQNGFRCRYTVSYRVGAEEGTAMTFRLVGSHVPESSVEFRCIEGKLERSH
jgi:hypothetical protein